MRQPIGASRGLLLVAALGAVAGATNASLCLARVPEPVHDNPTFGWVLVPAGALHGAMLGLIPVAGALVASRWRAISRVLLVVPVGWLAGYLSWIPLHHWVLDEPWRRALLWPFQNASWLGAAWAPFAYFGIVSATYFALLGTWGLQRGRVAHAACGACAGVLGSLWFWSEFEPWYFAIIHGIIWGLFVGTGAYRAGEDAKSRCWKDQGESQWPS